VALASSRVAQLRQNGFEQAALYDPPGVGGTTVITVLAHGDHPEWYGLPKDPQVPTAVRFWKSVLRPLGALAIAASFFAMVGHYLSFGPKTAKDSGQAPDDRGEKGGGRR
jgi:formate dehydrogenase iron-sulfur subunit